MRGIRPKSRRDQPRLARPAPPRPLFHAAGKPSTGRSPQRRAGQGAARYRTLSPLSPSPSPSPSVFHHIDHAGRCRLHPRPSALHIPSPRHAQGNPCSRAQTRPRTSASTLRPRDPTYYVVRRPARQHLRRSTDSAATASAAATGSARLSSAPPRGPAGHCHAFHAALAGHSLSATIKGKKENEWRAPNGEWSWDRPWPRDAPSSLCGPATAVGQRLVASPARLRSVQPAYQPQSSLLFSRLASSTSELPAVGATAAVLRFRRLRLLPRAVSTQHPDKLSTLPPRFT